MSAGIAWSNHCEADSDGTPQLLTSGTSAHAFDAAHPGARALDRNERKFARVNFTRDGSANEMTLRVQWSTSANSRTVRVIHLRRLVLPSVITSVRARVINFSGGAIETTDAVASSAMVDRAGYKHLFWELSQDRACAGVDLLLTANASSSGSWDLGLLWASEALIWPEGVDAGWKQVPIDDSTVARNPDGSDSVFEQSTRYGAEMNHSLLTYAQMFGDPANLAAPSLRRVLDEAGTRKRVLTWPRSSDVHQRQVLPVYGMLQAPLPDLAHRRGNRYMATLRVQ